MNIRKAYIYLYSLQSLKPTCAFFFIWVLKRINIIEHPTVVNTHFYCFLYEKTIRNSMKKMCKKVFNQDVKLLVISRDSRRLVGRVQAQQTFWKWKFLSMTLSSSSILEKNLDIHYLQCIKFVSCQGYTTYSGART